MKDSRLYALRRLVVHHTSASQLHHQNLQLLFTPSPAACIPPHVSHITSKNQKPAHYHLTASPPLSQSPPSTYLHTSSTRSHYDTIHRQRTVKPHTSPGNPRAPQGTIEYHNPANTPQLPRNKKKAVIPSKTACSHPSHQRASRSLRPQDARLQSP